MFSKNRNDLLSWEDYDETPAGRAFLKMPELWEDGTYPPKTEAPAVASVPKTPIIQSVAFKPSATPNPFKQTFADPFKASTPPSSGFDYGVPTPASNPNDPLDQLMDAFKIQQAVTEQRQSNLKNSPLNSAAYKPAPPTPAAVTPPVSSQPVITPEAAPAPFKKAETSHSQYPYEAVGELLQAASDKARIEVAEPLTRKVVNAVKNKQPVNSAELDSVENAGKVTRAVTKAVGDTYTKDNFIQAADAIHQGETEANETAYSSPVNIEDVMSAVHGGDIWQHGDTMANSNSTAHKGAEKSLREIRMSLQEVRLMGNKLIDPNGKYLDTKGLQQWINSERRYLKNIDLPEIMDFTKLDWKKDPDKFIEMGGRYFRESFLGSHLFSYGVDAIKGPGGAVPNQFFGTVVGIAKFYNKSDDMVGSVLGEGALATADIGWDKYVNLLSSHLPTLSRQALLFANSVMSKEVKAKMFNLMTADYRQRIEQTDIAVQGRNS